MSELVAHVTALLFLLAVAGQMARSVAFVAALFFFPTVPGKVAYLVAFVTPLSFHPLNVISAFAFDRAFASRNLQNNSSCSRLESMIRFFLINSLLYVECELIILEKAKMFYRIF